MDVGLVGLGSMGGGILSNLLKAGFPVIAHDLDPARVRAAQLAGAATGYPDAVGAAEVILLSLPGPAENDAVAVELLPRMLPGAVLVNMSTIGAAQARSFAKLAADRGVEYVDAPVTGAADGAREGMLVIMAGASDAALAKARPVLEPLAKAIHHCGPPGTGTAAKLLTNMLWFIHVTALTDALALGKLSGLEMGQFAELIRDSAGGSWVANHDLGNILAGDDDSSFALALCTKDLRLIHELAAGAGFPPEYAAIALGRFAAAEARFGSRGGELAVARLVEERMGISIREA